MAPAIPQQGKVPVVGSAQNAEKESTAARLVGAGMADVASVMGIQSADI